MSTAIVIGAGAWGLPAALELQDRGWLVTLVERFEPGNPYASSGGSTRLWRIADPQPWRAVAHRETVAAMDRLSERLGVSVYRRTGLVWRDTESLPDVMRSLESVDEPFQRVASDDVHEVFPGLRPDGRDALFIPEAGVVHADQLLTGALRAFLAAGGTYLPNTRVMSIHPGDASARISLHDGSTLDADQVLVAAGPGTRGLLTHLEIGLPLKPYAEQLVYFGDAALQPPAPDLPSLVDCPTTDQPGIYAMPNGARGYKVGLDEPLRTLPGATLGDDLGRDEVPERTEQIRARVERVLTAITPHVLATQVCTWTDSGDGDFIIGRTHPSVVLACGDSGEGFKFSAFMGPYLTDLVEGGGGDVRLQQHWTPERFANHSTPREHFDAVGRH